MDFDHTCLLLIIRCDFHEIVHNIHSFTCDIFIYSMYFEISDRLFCDTECKLLMLLLPAVINCLMNTWIKLSVGVLYTAILMYSPTGRSWIFIFEECPLRCLISLFRIMLKSCNKNNQCSWYFRNNELNFIHLM